MSSILFLSSREVGVGGGMNKIMGESSNEQIMGECPMAKCKRGVTKQKPIWGKQYALEGLVSRRLDTPKRLARMWARRLLQKCRQGVM